MINKSIDYDLIINKVSIAMNNCHRVGREQLADGHPQAIIVKLSS